MKHNGQYRYSGQKLLQVSPLGLDLVFSTLTDLLNKSSLNTRTQDVIDVLLTIREDQFKTYPILPLGFNIVPESNKYTHKLELDAKIDHEFNLGKRNIQF